MINLPSIVNSYTIFLRQLDYFLEDIEKKPKIIL